MSKQGHGSKIRVFSVPRWDDPVVIAAGRLFIDALLLSARAPKRWSPLLTGLRGGGTTPKVKFGHLRSRLPIAVEVPDVVHFEWNSWAVDYLPMYDVWDCPVVISCRGSQIHVAPHLPGSQPFVDKLRVTFEKAAAVHCVSKAIAREASQYGLSPRKVWVIPPAVDPNFFRPLTEPPPPNNVFRLVTTGSLIWRKGYEYGLLAIRQLIDRGVPAHLDIIGNGPELQRLQYTVADLRLQHHVQLHGSRSPAQVRDLLRCADAFLLASVAEGISNAALEAMSCELPVVTANVGGMREAVEDGVNGYVVAPRSPDEMASALLQLALDDDVRRAFGRSARETVLRQFSLQKQTDRFLDLYGAVTGVGESR